MKRTTTPAGYVVSLTGNHSAFTPAGILIGRFERKRDALEATPNEITRQRQTLADILGTDAVTVASINAMGVAELNEWLSI